MATYTATAEEAKRNQYGDLLARSTEGSGVSGGLASLAQTTPANTSSAKRSALPTGTAEMPQGLTVGSRGADVTSLQQNLIDLGYAGFSTPDGIFGTKTNDALKKFQTSYGLESNGIADENTMSALQNAAAALAATGRGVVGSGSTGSDVKALQQALINLGYADFSTPDGIFGSGTETALKRFQNDNGINADGVAGAKTWPALQAAAAAWAQENPNSFNGLYSLDEIARKEFTSRYADEIADILGQAQNYGTYESPYAQRIAALTDELENSRFTYDPATDPVYQAMRKTYLNEADRTAADVLGRASMATGGRASTQAINAASQAANYYKSQLAGRQAELFDAAYNRYRQDFAQRLGMLQELEGQDATQYGRWGDDYTRLLQGLSAYQSQDNSEYSRFLNTQQALTNSQQQNYQNLVNLITSTGYVPYNYELTRAGMNRATANRWKEYFNRSITGTGGSGGSGGGGGGGSSSYSGGGSYYGGGGSSGSGGSGSGQSTSGGVSVSDLVLDMGGTPASWSSLLSTNYTPTEQKKVTVPAAGSGGGGKVTLQLK